MAFYRHFIERTDFDVKVATNSEHFVPASVPYQAVKFGPSRLTRRLFRTRWMPWFYGPHSLTAWGRVPGNLWRAAREFQPDMVFTVAGSWDYSALVAERVARNLKIPLAASFNDWFDYGWFPSHPTFHAAIARRFQRLYRDADLALCTCEGMRDALGPHPNPHILYPLGAGLPEGENDFVPFKEGARKFVVAFAGSMADWYGPMLERLATTAQAQAAPVDFRFYGSNPNWTPEFKSLARDKNIFRGHLPFAELQREMAGADALILPMGFGEQCARVERTSFKTKFLDYLTYQKPIVVWGPEYCSAVRVANEFDSAEVCTQPEAAGVLKAILALSRQSERQAALVVNARKMYEDRFHPDKIHASFVAKMQETVDNHRRLSACETRS